MLLFSKRNSENPEIEHWLMSRILSQISYCTRNWFFEECFLSYFDRSRWTVSGLNESVLNTLSKWELGYDLSQHFDYQRMELNLESQHWYLFDVLELMIIFSKPEKRDEFIARLRNLFEEEGNSFIIHNYLVVPNLKNGFQSLIPFVKDRKLRQKLESYYKMRSVGAEHSSLAKVSAEILNYILSSNEDKKKNKEFSEWICKRIWEKWAPEKKDELFDLINRQSLIAKEFNNNIEDVRHTERHTISVVEQSGVHKFIADNNMNLVEFIITSIPEEYISDWNSEDVKKSLLEKYSIQKDSPMEMEDFATF